MSDLEEVITLTEAAALFPLSRSALAKAAQRDRLRHRVTADGLILTTRADVARYVAQVEAWNDNGRAPRNRKRRRMSRSEAEALLP